MARLVPVMRDGREEEGVQERAQGRRLFMAAGSGSSSLVGE